MPLFLLRTISSHPLQRQKPGVYKFHFSGVFHLSCADATLPTHKASLKNRYSPITPKEEEWQSIFTKTPGEQNKPISNTHPRLDIMAIKRLDSCVWKERCLNVRSYNERGKQIHLLMKIKERSYYMPAGEI